MRHILCKEKYPMFLVFVAVVKFGVSDKPTASVFRLEYDGHLI